MLSIEFFFWPILAVGCSNCLFFLSLEFISLDIVIMDNIFDFTINEQKFGHFQLGKPITIFMMNYEEFYYAMVRWHLGKEPLHTTESAIMVPFLVDMCMSYNFYLLSVVCWESSGWRCPWGPRKSSRSRRKDNSHQKPSSSPQIHCSNYRISFTSLDYISSEPNLLHNVFTRNRSIWDKHRHQHNGFHGG
jgi:hypothetical protein